MSHAALNRRHGRAVSGGMHQEGTQIRLSRLAPLDLASIRDDSMAMARQDLQAGARFRPVEIAIYRDAARPILTDGRHRVLVAMRTGHATLPAIVRVYGPRGGLRESRRGTLVLDALP